MSHPEMLTEIDRVSGPATRLREIRAALPSARTRRPVAARAKKATREGRPAAARAAAPAAAAGALTHPQRLTVIDQALLMLEAFYAHLPLKRALHAIDPIQRLRLLRLRHEALDERDFQSEMIDIFVGLRDLHTNYILPERLPPQVRLPAVPRRGVLRRRASASTWSPGSRRATPSATLVPGVEVTHWNGMPDRSRGGAQRRPRGRQQPRGPARPGPRSADAALVRHVAAARRGLGRPDLHRRQRRGAGVALRMGGHRARDAAAAAAGCDGARVGGAPRPARASTSRPSCCAACARRSSIRRR